MFGTFWVWCITRGMMVYFLSLQTPNPEYKTLFSNFFLRTVNETSVDRRI
jgi:hypothetical protein